MGVVKAVSVSVLRSERMCEYYDEGWMKWNQRKLGCSVHSALPKKLQKSRDVPN